MHPSCTVFVCTKTYTTHLWLAFPHKYLTTRHMSTAKRCMLFRPRTKTCCFEVPQSNLPMRWTSDLPSKAMCTKNAMRKMELRWIMIFVKNWRSYPNSRIGTIQSTPKSWNLSILEWYCNITADTTTNLNTFLFMSPEKLNIGHTSVFVFYVNRLTECEAKKRNTVISRNMHLKSAHASIGKGWIYNALSI